MKPLLFLLLCLAILSLACTFGAQSPVATPPSNNPQNLNTPNPNNPSQDINTAQPPTAVVGTPPGDSSGTLTPAAGTITAVPPAPIITATAEAVGTATP